MFVKYISFFLLFLNLLMDRETLDIMRYPGNRNQATKIDFIVLTILI